MWASCFATVRPREASGTASKPFLGMAFTRLRLMALLTRQASRACSSKERSFMATPVVHCRDRRDRRKECSRRGQERPEPASSQSRDERLLLQLDLGALTWALFAMKVRFR